LTHTMLEIASRRLLSTRRIGDRSSNSRSIFFKWFANLGPVDPSHFIIPVMLQNTIEFLSEFQWPCVYDYDVVHSL
jgi:hypothetical protein